MLLSLSLITITQTNAQIFNNGGFENYTSCPTGPAETNKIIGAAGTNDTPDYYNCTINPGSAYSGTGSLYLGAIRNEYATTQTNTHEGLNLILDNPLIAGTTYSISFQTNYNVLVLGDPGFDYSMYRNCYTLRLAFGNSNQSGVPSTYQFEVDGDQDHGNANNSYHYYSFQFTPTQNYSMLYLINTPTPKTSASTPAPECCTCNSSVAYIYRFLVDDLDISSTTNIEESNTKSINLFIRSNTLYLKNINESISDEIHIYDLLGKKILSQPVRNNPNGTQKINIENLITGMYVVKVGNRTQKIFIN